MGQQSSPLARQPQGSNGGMCDLQRVRQAGSVGLHVPMAIFTSLISQVFFLLLFIREVMSHSLQAMNGSTSGFPVLHYLLEFAQTHTY